MTNALIINGIDYSNETQSYPATFSMLLNELHWAFGFDFEDIAQSAEFLKGKVLLRSDGITGTFRNSVVEMLVNNGAAHKYTRKHFTGEPCTDIECELWHSWGAAKLPETT